MTEPTRQPAHPTAELAARRAIAEARTLVIKVGSALLAAPSGSGLDHARLAAIARDVAHACHQGRRVVIVSSGAIACGRERVCPGRAPATIVEKQAAAAVGQADLIAAWSAALADHGVAGVGQVLLTADDLADRQRFLNARRTLDMLLSAQLVPVINENDSVAFEQIRLGDNDTLAARVTGLIDAEALIILSAADGVREDLGRGAVIPLINDPELEAPKLVGPMRTDLGTGGMATKLEAAALAQRFGSTTLIAPGPDPTLGEAPTPLAAALNGEPIGTVIPAADARPPSLRKKWLASTRAPAGALLVDVGAERALLARGASLLPVGLRDVRGEFGRGELVEIVGPHGNRLALGLASYDSGDLRALAGRRTDEIEPVLGFRYCDEAVHRDDLVVTASAPGPAAGAAP